MVSGPYRSGTQTQQQRDENLHVLNAAAVALFRRGHTPVIGVNVALPMIQAGGGYDEVMMPVSLALCERCDAVLRVGGPSKGADDEVERFKAAGKPVYEAVDEVPIAPPRP